MNRVLVVVDMQNDFIDCALGTPQAVVIVPKVVERIAQAKANKEEILLTLDTHGENYLSTQEGKYLPVIHCVEGTFGWELNDKVAAATKGCKTFKKPTFGSLALADYLKGKKVDEVELIGLCTDICVISNAMILKAALPETKIVVDSSCCAGATMEGHKVALDAMKNCQIIIKGE
jgi:nicotinamidase-related amidase